MRTVCLSLLVTLGLGIAAQAGVVFEFESRAYGPVPSPPQTVPIAPPQTVLMAADGTNFAMEIEGDPYGPGGRLIYRGGSQEVCVVNYHTATYFVINLQTLQALSLQIQQTVDQAGQLTPQNPAKGQATTQSLITGGPPATQPPTIAVVDTGEPTRVNGYPCVRHEVRCDGVKIRDVWITDWGNVDGGWEIAAVFTAMAQFVQNINQSLPAGSGSSFEDNIFASLRDINGFPVASRDYMPDGNTKIETTLRGTTLHPLSPATFLPPPGYRQQSFLAP